MTLDPSETTARTQKLKSSRSLKRISTSVSEMTLKMKSVKIKTWSCKLIIQIVMTVGFFLVELIVGYTNKSVALVADAFHMLSDVIALIVGLVAVRFQKKSTKNPQYTFGYLRA